MNVDDYDGWYELIKDRDEAWRQVTALRDALMHRGLWAQFHSGCFGTDGTQNWLGERRFVTPAYSLSRADFPPGAVQATFWTEPTGGEYVDYWIEVVRT